MVLCDLNASHIYIYMGSLFLLQENMCCHKTAEYIHFSVMAKMFSYKDSLTVNYHIQDNSLGIPHNRSHVEHRECSRNTADTNKSTFKISLVDIVQSKCLSFKYT